MWQKFRLSPTLSLWGPSEIYETSVRREFTDGLGYHRCPSIFLVICRFLGHMFTCMYTQKLSPTLLWVSKVYVKLASCDLIFNRCVCFIERKVFQKLATTGLCCKDWTSIWGVGVWFLKKLHFRRVFLPFHTNSEVFQTYKRAHVFLAAQPPQRMWQKFRTSPYILPPGHRFFVVLFFSWNKLVIPLYSP